MDISDLVFVAFGRYVIALDRNNGEKFWEWKSPQGAGYAAVLLDGDRLIVSVMGYTYCLNPVTGEVMWENDLPGLGTGVASLTSVRGTSRAQRAAAEEEEEEEEQRRRRSSN